MDTARRIGWIAVLTYALSGCMVWNGVSSLFAGTECGGGAQARLAAVDWSEAEVIEVRIRQGQFNPMLLRMRQGLPYILRLTNADDSVRVFNAREFFGAVAVHRVLIGGSEEDSICISAVAVPAQDVAEVQLLAGRDGRYQFEDNPFVFLPVPGGSGLGIVTIARDATRVPGALPQF